MLEKLKDVKLIKTVLCIALAAALTLGCMVMSSCGESADYDDTTTLSVATSAQQTISSSTAQTTAISTTAPTKNEQKGGENNNNNYDYDDEEDDKPAGNVDFKKQVISHEISGALPYSDPVSSKYFNDCVFIGDSVSLKLELYEASRNVLGSAAFLTAGSFGTNEALKSVSSESTHPRYKGQKLPIEDNVTRTGKHKVYIMLGMNDIGWSSISEATKRMEKVCNNILNKNPKCEIYIQSMTPIAEKSNVKSKNGINNSRVHEYNVSLCALCQRKGWKFVNVASVMYNSDGDLKKSYCSDYGEMGLHFTDDGCNAWVQYLYTHTGIFKPKPTTKPTTTKPRTTAKPHTTTKPHTTSPIISTTEPTISTSAAQTTKSVEPTKKEEGEIV